MKERIVFVLSKFFVCWLCFGFITASINFNSYSSPNQSNNTINIAPQSVQMENLGNNNSDIFWFLHITDTQALYRDPARIAWFQEFLNNTQRVINPKFIVNTGDLTGEDYGGFFTPFPGPDLSEWQVYDQVLNETGMNASFYYDLNGNHDNYQDINYQYYLNYSMQHKLYYDFTIQTMQGKYHFIALNTAEYDGIRYPFELFGDMGQTQLNWYQSVLQSNTDANMTIDFGHHPAYEIADGGEQFFQINQEYKPALYLCGHGHENAYQLVDDRMVSWETRIFTAYNDSYRIIAIDNDGIATDVFSKDQWPVGLITSPISTQNIYSNYDLNKLTNFQQIHVLAWDPWGIKSVEWRATQNGDDEGSFSAWQPMHYENGSLYTAPVNIAIKDGQAHILQTQIIDVNGSNTVTEITFQSTPTIILGWWIARPLIIMAVIIIMVGMPIMKYARRNAGVGRVKTTIQTVDPTLRKIMFIKFLIILFIPFTIAPIWPNEVDGVFSFFYWRPIGIEFIVMNVLFSASVWLFGFLFLLMNLSPQKRYWMAFFAIPISFGAVIFIIGYYTYIMGLICLWAPGFFGEVICDIFILKHEIYLIKKYRLKSN